MKFHLSTGQAKVANHSSEIVARLIFGAHRSGFDIAVRDPGMPCRLMARERWTEGKCKSYAHSGSKTCMECYHRPALLKVGDPWRVPSEAMRTTLTGERIKLREELSMAKIGICAKCDEERTIVAKGMCTGCNYGPNKDLTREQVLEKKAAGAIRTRKTAVKSGGAPLPPFDATQLRTSGTEVPAGQGILILLRGNDDNRLYQRIMERARKNRREPGDELLALAEASLDNGNGTEKVEIGKIRNIVERMSRYPVPNGSAKEVFVEAFNMMLIRLDEMEGK